MDVCVRDLTDLRERRLLYRMAQDFFRQFVHLFLQETFKWSLKNSYFPISLSNATVFSLFPHLAMERKAPPH